MPYIPSSRSRRGVSVIRDYDPEKPMMHPDDPRRFDEPCDGNDHTVTAPVTPTAWERVGMTEEEWNALAIPPQFIRTGPSPPTSLANATAPAAASGGGKRNGSASNAKTLNSTPPTAPAPIIAADPFAQFKTVTPDDIERQIRREADRRRREWMPSKGDKKENRKQPRLSFFIRQVRKEFYP